MEDLVTHIARAIVEHPDDVSVARKAGDGQELYELSVNQDDLGQVIGRQGRTAKAIRAVVRAAAAKRGENAQVEIVE